jgi:hypothetical protein
MTGEGTWGGKLRSLQRRRLYEIFGPLDPGERLPRELLLEKRRDSTWGRQHVAGFLWLPAFVTTVFVVLWAFGNAAAALAAVALLFTAFWLFAFARRR